MNLNIDEVIGLVKGFIPALGAFLIIVFGFWVKGVMKQKQRNDINEIDLSAKKIDFETHSQPIDDLVSDSNKSHGADAMVEDAGDLSKKK